MPRVLVVDDDPQILKLYSQILAKGGHEVRTEASGKRAFQLLETPEQIDLLVLDLSMPEPDGFETLKSVRAQRPELKILVTSGFLNGALLKRPRRLAQTHRC